MANNTCKSRIFCILLILFIVFSCEEKKYIPTYPPSEFQKKLVGEWSGNAETINGTTWKIDVTFTESGHYIASAYDVSDTLDIGSPFRHGFRRVDYPDGEFILLPPSPDIPCTSFIIDYILNMKGYGILSVGREYERDGEITHFICWEASEIRDLEFKQGGDELIFNLTFIGDDGDDWYIKYNLYRVSKHLTSGN